MLKEIVTISGHSGLFKIISKNNTGTIIESIETKKRMPTYPNSQISILEHIAIYTEGDSIPLYEVLKKIYIKENGKEILSHKSSNEQLKSYFEETIPNYDKTQVYVSNIKKIVNWYNILHKANLMDFSDKKDEKKSKIMEENNVTKPEESYTIKTEIKNDENSTTI